MIGTDPRTDLALIKVEGGSDFPYAKLSTGKARIGDWVLAVGNPFGLGGTVTAGIVSANGRDIGNGPYDDFIQIDAPVNKGNSGGPAFDMQGNVIGVNTAIYSPSGGSVGIAFSIPASTVKAVVKSCRRRARSAAAGSRADPQVTPGSRQPRPDKRRARCCRAAAGRPRRQGRIESGDVITGVNDQPVKDRASSPAPSAPVAARPSAHRGPQGPGKTVTLTLGELPSGKAARSDTDRDDRGDRAGAAPPCRTSPHAGARQQRRRRGKDGVVVVDVDRAAPRPSAASRKAMSSSRSPASW